MRLRKLKKEFSALEIEHRAFLLVSQEGSGHRRAETALDPSVLLAGGGAVTYYVPRYKDGVILGVILLVAFVAILFGLVRLVLNLIALKAPP